MWKRSELKTRAKAVLKRFYWKSLVVSFLLALVSGSGAPSFNFGGGGDRSSGGTGTISSGGSSGGIESLLDQEIMLWVLLIAIVVGSVIFLFAAAFRIFLGYPLEVGARRYFNQCAVLEESMDNLGFGFDKKRYFGIVKSMLWRGFINFLWFLLLYIPGIVKAYAYSMVPFILADNPNIGYKRALQLSNQMTRGHKFRMWVLDLSFIGWYLLGILAFFIGLIFVMPYVNATKSELYFVLRRLAIENGLTSSEELQLKEAVL